MILSQTSVYALKAVLHLAETGGGDFVRVDDIAADLKVPRNYLSKILHALARTGVLDSTRGPHGGFRLGKNPAKLTLDEVLAPFDEVIGESACLLGRKRCSDANPCAAHDRWKGVYAGVKTFFQETTVADLARGAIPEITLH
ncbi:MAG TPA: Rrf2 family transcriptional regulator [Gemmatimonadales bacterium]|nr:Rrf2 family transcriptional regulator [Gemmatimonadales bacterium]